MEEDPIPIPDEPSGASLLGSAREALLERLLPALPRELRYDGLMIANAMGIAGRELEAVPRDVDERWRDALCDRMRRGAELPDADERRRLHDDIRRRLVLANPKRLAGAIDVKASEATRSGGDRAT